MNLFIKRLIADSKGSIIGSEEAEPICGEDFCETCGECLWCYVGEPCYPDKGNHMWVRYLNDDH